MARLMESDQAMQANQRIEMEVASELEPRIEILGAITERVNKYGPLSEPGFRRPSG